MSRFRLKISMDNIPIVRANANDINDFDTVMRQLKQKFGGKK